MNESVGIVRTSTIPDLNIKHRERMRQRDGVPLRPHVRGREFGVKTRWQVRALSEGTPIWLRSHKRRGAGGNRKRP